MTRMPGTMSTMKDESSDGDHSPKPVNVFYVWYSELCRRAGVQTLNYVKPPKLKNENVLDFVCDRMKPDEWTPVINALRLDTSLHVVGIHSRNRCKFLHDVDTEEKLRQMKRRAGSLYTTYIARSLLKAVANCVKRNKVLTSLELDGVPFGIEDVEALVEALKKNKTIKILSLKCTQIRDLGCQLLCESLRQMPNIEVLNLSSCGLGAISAQYIAKVVRFQQINRYCESWHNSLRYEDPEVGIMAGLKRITLNNNPAIGDEGLTYILDELDDDLWIKALDMQRCGITENIGRRLLDVIAYSRSLEIADFRVNDLAQTTIDQIFELLKEKRTCGASVSQYKWCFTTSTLQGSTAQEAPSNCSVFYPPGKSKSMPNKQCPMGPSTPPSGIPLRRTKTSLIITKKASTQTIEKYNRSIIVPGEVNGGAQPPQHHHHGGDFKRSYTCLNSELQRETNRRIQSEMENKKLKAELERIKSMSTVVAHIPPNNSNKTKKKMVVGGGKNVQFNTLPRTKAKSAKTHVSKKEKIAANHIEMSNHFQPANNVEFVFEKQNLAYNILQNLVGKASSGLERSPPKVDDSETEMVNYFKDVVDECQPRPKRDDANNNCNRKNNNDQEDDDDEEEDEDDEDEDDGSSSMVDSQASLIRFMRDIKTKNAKGEQHQKSIWNSKNFLQKVH